MDAHMGALEGHKILSRAFRNFKTHKFLVFFYKSLTECYVNRPQRSFYRSSWDPAHISTVHDPLLLGTVGGYGCTRAALCKSPPSQQGLNMSHCPGVVWWKEWFLISVASSQRDSFSYTCSGSVHLHTVHHVVEDRRQKFWFWNFNKDWSNTGYWSRICSVKLNLIIIRFGLDIPKPLGWWWKVTKYISVFKYSL